MALFDALQITAKGGEADAWHNLLLDMSAETTLVCTDRHNAQNAVWTSSHHNSTAYVCTAYGQQALKVLKRGATTGCEAGSAPPRQLLVQDKKEVVASLKAELSTLKEEVADSKRDGSKTAELLGALFGLKNSGCNSSAVAIYERLSQVADAPVVVDDINPKAKFLNDLARHAHDGLPRSVSNKMTEMRAGIAFTSNGFALLGLRSLYTVVANAVDDFIYLRPAIAVVLGFIGVKLIGEFGGYEIPTVSSLLIVLGVLGTGVGLSVLEATSLEEDEAVDLSSKEEPMEAEQLEQPAGGQQEEP